MLLRAGWNRGHKHVPTMNYYYSQLLTDVRLESHCGQLCSIMTAEQTAQCSLPVQCTYSA